MTKRKPLAEPLPEPPEGYQAREGMRVQILTADKKRNLGLGTITEVGDFWVQYPDGGEEKLTDNYPGKIILDNGRVTEGIKCWWYPINESQSEQDKKDGKPEDIIGFVDEYVDDPEEFRLRKRS